MIRTHLNPIAETLEPYFDADFLCQTCVICLNCNCPITDDGRSRKYRKSDTTIVRRFNLSEAVLC
jgi:hypothetical protein